MPRLMNCQGVHTRVIGNAVQIPDENLGYHMDMNTVVSYSYVLVYGWKTYLNYANQELNWISTV